MLTSRTALQFSSRRSWLPWHRPPCCSGQPLWTARRATSSGAWPAKWRCRPACRPCKTSTTSAPAPLHRVRLPSRRAPIAPAVRCAACATASRRPLRAGASGPGRQPLCMSPVLRTVSAWCGGRPDVSLLPPSCSKTTLPPPPLPLPAAQSCCALDADPSANRPCFRLQMNAPPWLFARLLRQALSE